MQLNFWYSTTSIFGRAISWWSSKVSLIKISGRAHCLKRISEIVCVEIMDGRFPLSFRHGYCWYLTSCAPCDICPPFLSTVRCFVALTCHGWENLAAGPHATLSFTRAFLVHFPKLSLVYLECIFWISQWMFVTRYIIIIENAVGLLLQSNGDIWRSDIWRAHCFSNRYLSGLHRQMLTGGRLRLAFRSWLLLKFLT